MVIGAWTAVVTVSVAGVLARVGAAWPCSIERGGVLGEERPPKQSRQRLPPVPSKSRGARAAPCWAAASIAPWSTRRRSGLRRRLPARGRVVGTGSARNGPKERTHPAGSRERRLDGGACAGAERGVSLQRVCPLAPLRLRGWLGAGHLHRVAFAKRQSLSGTATLAPFAIMNRRYTLAAVLPPVSGGAWSAR